MNSLVNYMIEANAGLIFFFGIYYLLLRNETDFRKQRFFLLAGVVCALVSPMVQIDLIAAEPILQPDVSNLTIVLPEFVVGESGSAIRTADLLVLMYIVVAIVIAVPIVGQCIRMYRSVRSVPGSYRGDYYVIESGNSDPSWSFFRLIFIGQSDRLTPEEKELIVKHEMLHGRLLHSVDILLFTLLWLVFWFNPIVWIYRKTIARIHEFEVDAIVAAGSNGADYGLLLAKTALSANGFLLTHHFNQSFILKRINMLNMLKGRISSWKASVLATTVVVYFVAVACTELEMKKNVARETGATPSDITAEFERLKVRYPEKTLELLEVTNTIKTYQVPEGKSLIYLSTAAGRTWVVTASKDINREVFTIVENTAEPLFGFEAFYKQLSQVIVYPDAAMKKGVEGKVFVEFVVNEDGALSDFKVVKGISEECDTEAMRAIMQLGKWSPGRQAGKAVPQRLVLPITFNLD